MAKFKKVPKELPLQKNLVSKRDFNYSKGGMGLNFSLNLEKKSVQNFKDCLVEALLDVNETLGELK